MAEKEIQVGKIAMTLKGTWDSQVDYEPLDVVNLNGSSWAARQENNNVTPGTNDKIWQIVAYKGDKGNKGDTGTPSDPIGGRNLMMGTADYPNNSDEWDLRGTRSDDFFGNLRISQTASVWTSPLYKVADLQARSLVELNTPYTFSAWARNTSDNDIKVAAYGSIEYMSDMHGSMNLLKAHGDWQRVSVTFEFIKDFSGDSFGIRWETGDSIVNGKFQLAGYKLERGNVATDWTPAPEEKADDNDVIHKTRPFPFTDFNSLKGRLLDYSGYYYQDAPQIANGPQGEPSGWGSIEVIGRANESAGIILYSFYSGNRGTWIGLLNDNNPIYWKKLADDSTVVHTSGNETIADTKTFTSPIVGALATRLATFTDFSVVAKNMTTYSGNWYVGGTSIANDPQGGKMIWYNVSVIRGGDTTGTIIVTDFAGNQTYIGTVVGGNILGWKLLADDASVVHKSSDESIAGDKKFLGKVTVDNASKYPLNATVTLDSMKMLYGTISAIRVGNIVQATYNKPNSTDKVGVNTTSVEAVPADFRPLAGVKGAGTDSSGGTVDITLNPNGTLRIGNTYIDSGKSATITFTYPVL